MEKNTAPENRNEQIPAPEENTQIEPGKKRNGRYRLLGAGVLLLLALWTVFYYVPGERYKKAEAMFSAGQYEEARAAYEKLGSYKDSRARAGECVSASAYDEAGKLEKEGRYDEAIAAFEALGDYKDSARRSEDCRREMLEEEYLQADTLFLSGDYGAAGAAFEALGEYKDSPARCRECADREKYAAAAALFEQGEYEKAVAAFEALGNVKDAPELVSKAKYSHVKAHDAAGDLLSRRYLLELAEQGYEDSSAILERILNNVTAAEFENNDVGRENVRLSFYLLPDETVTVLLPAVDNIVYTNDNADWAAMELDIPQEAYYPHTPLDGSQYTVTPEIVIKDVKGGVRIPVFESFTIAFPAAELMLTEPAVIPEEGVMCAEDGTLLIAGTVREGTTAVTVNGADTALDEKGGFRTVFTLPGSEPGQVTVTASGNDRITTSYTFIALPCVKEQPAPSAEAAESEAAETDTEESSLLAGILDAEAAAPAVPEMTEESRDLRTEKAVSKLSDAIARTQVVFIPEKYEIFMEPKTGTVISPENAVVLGGPGPEYAVFAGISFGRSFEVLGYVPGWFLIEYRENAFAWIEAGSFFAPWMTEAMVPALAGLAPAETYYGTPEKRIVTAQEGLALYSGIEGEDTPRCEFSCGAECIVLGETADRCLVTCEGMFGWAAKSGIA